MPDQDTDQPVGFNPNTDEQSQQDQLAQLTQAQTPPQPQQPTAQGPQAAPQGQASQPSAQAQQPQSDHSKWYQKVMEAASGGPVRYTTTDPKTGQVTQVVNHRPMRSMAASILAGAVAGMMGGLQAPSVRNSATGGLDLSGAAQAGAQAGQRIAQAPSQAAQKMSDQQLVAAIATTDHNMKLHAQHLADERLEGQNADAAYTRLKQQENDAAPILASMDATYKDLNLPNTSQEMSGDELERRMVKGDIHVARDSAFIIGSKPIIGPDGQITGYMPQYRVYDPTAKVAITDDIKKAYPRFANVADGQMIPIQGFYRDYNQKQNNRWSQSFSSQLEQDFNDNGMKVDKGAFNSILPQLTKYSAAIAGLDPDQIPDALRKAGASESTINQLTSLYPQGYKAQTFVNARDTEKKQAEAIAGKAPVEQSRIDKLPTLAASLGLSPAQTSAALARVPSTVDEYDAVVKSMQDQSNKNRELQVAKENKAAATSDKDQQTMWKTGINPSSHERLSLDNAPDEFMVDTSTGRPIPTSMLSAKKPTMQESNRADFAKSAIHSLDKLNDLIDSNEAKFGPIVGPVDKWMASHGLGDEYQQAALNYLTFAQSAATGAHVGGRFNVPIMDKMGTTISANMSKDQLKGATESISDVMQQYVDQGGRFTVAQYKTLPQTEKDRLQGKTQPKNQPQTPRVVPVGAIPGRDANGNIIGYKTADGKVVKF